ncbi:MAG: T9SS type A sorting domain-containing protein, partial [Bacteroidales bacterium]|nr:T9SS type A sorting domain-containing protein [Bacteroidales bacterium]
VYAGTYSARSKSNLGDGSYYSNKESILQITMNVSQASPISYFRKVSSEQNYDKFTFAIDGTVKEELSGEVAWGEASFDVPVGNHTFKFTYSKDYSSSNGSDCAWIDNITFPVSGTIMGPTSIENNEIDQQLCVYPNPAKEQINIQCPNNMKSIEIIDIMGKSVKCLNNISGNNYTLNISNWANAIYFVKVTDTDNQVYIQKIIKK